MENLTISSESLVKNNIGIRLSYNSKSNPFNEKFKYSSLNFDDFNNVQLLKDYFRDEAINNLIKKTKFLQLYIQLIENQIDEDEYEMELTSNPDEYFIEMKELKSQIDFIALLSVLQKLPKNLSVDDVSEIFGIQQELLLNKMLN